MSPDGKTDDLEIKETYEIYIPYNSKTKWLDDLLNEESKIKTNKDTNDEDVINLVTSRNGKTILKYNGYTYRKSYTNKIGHRWKCSKDKSCSAYIYTDDDNQILEACEDHLHRQYNRHQDVDTGEKGKYHTIIVIFIIKMKCN